MPTLAQVIRPVGKMPNDPDWLGDATILSTWQRTLARANKENDGAWVVRVVSDVYPELLRWFDEKWNRVLRRSCADRRDSLTRVRSGSGWHAARQEA